MTKTKIVYRIPFQNSILVTGFHPLGTMKDLFVVVRVVVRGVENLPVVIGVITLPPTARVRQF